MPFSRRPPARRQVRARALPFCQPLEPRRLLSAGELDLTFGGDGTVTVDIPGSLSESTLALAVQADGKRVVASVVAGDMLVSRYAADGSLDAGFGAAGSTRINFGAFDAPRDIALDSQGRVVVAGHTSVDPSRRGGNFAVARLTPSGELDTTFDSDGLATVDFGQRDAAYGVAVRGDDRIVLAGHSQPEGNSNAIGQFAVAALTADGAPDPTFDGDGRHTLQVGNANTNAAASDVFIDEQGRFVVGGTTGFTAGSFALARYHPDGSLDAGFGAGGLVLTPMTGAGVLRGLAPAQGGRIVAGGYARATMFNVDTDFAAVRYNADGSLDTSFDGDGKALVDTKVEGTSRADRAHAVAVAPDGSVVLAGVSVTANPAGTNDPLSAVARLTPAGAPDPSFSADGWLLSVPWQFNAVALLPGGGIAAAGETPDRGPFGSGDVMLAAFTAAGTPDPSFGGDGVVTTDHSGPVFNRAKAVAVQGDGKVLLGGEVESGNDRVTDFGIARLNPDGTPDLTFGGGTGYVVNDFANHQDWLEALAVLPDGRILAAGHYNRNYNEDVLVARYLPDGTPDLTFGGGTGRVAVGNVDNSGDLSETALDMAVQPDGRIVLVGTTSSANASFVVIRLDPSGAPDATFGGGDGATLVPVPGVGMYAMAFDVAIDAAGRILVGGGGSGFAVARLDPAGNPDPTFDGDGVAVSTFSATGANTTGYAVAPDAHGRVVVAGKVRATSGAQADFGLMRFTENGAVDTSFGTGGKVTTDFAGADDEIRRVFVLADGSVLAGGVAQAGPQVPGSPARADFALARYTPDGVLDPAFGAGGKVVTDFGGSYEFAYDMVLDAEGRAVLAGEALGDFAAARYLVQAPPPPRVESVSVSSARWAAAFRQQLRDDGLAGAAGGFAAPADADGAGPLPWVNLDRVSITFSRNVRVEADDLRVRGARVAAYALDAAAFTYDAATRTATWALPAGTVFGADRILLDLDGGPQGVRAGSVALDGDVDGAAGGDFRSRLNVLPGDADRSGTTGWADAAAVRAARGASGTPAHPVFQDLNGDGRVDARDTAIARASHGATLPAAQPTPAAPAAPPPARRARPPVRPGLADELLR